MAPKDYLGGDQRKVADDKAKKEDDIKTLDAGDIHLLKTYGQVRIFHFRKFRNKFHILGSVRKTDKTG